MQRGFDGGLTAALDPRFEPSQSTLHRRKPAAESVRRFGHHSSTRLRCGAALEVNLTEEVGPGERRFERRVVADEGMSARGSRQGTSTCLVRDSRRRHAVSGLRWMIGGIMRGHDRAQGKEKEQTQASGRWCIYIRNASGRRRA